MTKKINYKKEFDEHTFRAHVTVFVGSSFKPKRDRSGYVELTSTKYGEYNKYLLWLKEWEWRIWDYSRLAHEVYHLVKLILDVAGVDDEESYAYYTQYWMETILIDFQKKIKRVE